MDQAKAASQHQLQWVLIPLKWQILLGGNREHSLTREGTLANMHRLLGRNALYWVGTIATGR